MHVISPFAKTGTVVHDLADRGSVSKFIETVFGLPTFGSLPDEQTGVSDGYAPLDAEASTSNLLDALDPAKLSGTGNPAPLVMIPSPSLPPAMNCDARNNADRRADIASERIETEGYYAVQSATSILRKPAARRDGAD